MEELSDEQKKAISKYFGNKDIWNLYLEALIQNGPQTTEMIVYTRDVVPEVPRLVSMESLAFGLAASAFLQSLLTTPPLFPFTNLMGPIVQNRQFDLSIRNNLLQFLNQTSPVKNEPNTMRVHGTNEPNPMKASGMNSGKHQPSKQQEQQPKQKRYCRKCAVHNMMEHYTKSHKCEFKACSCEKCLRVEKIRSRKT